MANIITTAKQQREHNDAAEARTRRKAAEKGLDYDGLKKEGYRPYKRSIGSGRTVVTVPELPWKKGR